MSKPGEPGHRYTFLVRFFVGGTTIQALLFLVLTALHAVLIVSAEPTAEGYARLSYLAKNLTAFSFVAILVLATAGLGLWFRGTRDSVIQDFASFIYTSRSAMRCVLTLLALFASGLFSAFAYYHTPDFQAAVVLSEIGSLVDQRGPELVASLKALYSQTPLINNAFGAGMAIQLILGSIIVVQILRGRWPSS